jgi:hypothetical protein
LSGGLRRKTDGRKQSKQCQDCRPDDAPRPSMLLCLPARLSPYQVRPRFSNMTVLCPCGPHAVAFLTQTFVLPPHALVLLILAPNPPPTSGI